MNQSSFAVGDLLLIPVHGDLVTLGQVLDETEGIHYLVAIDSRTHRRDSLPTALRMTAERVALLGIVIDPAWPVIGHHSPVEVPLPAFMVGGHVEDFSGTRRRRITREEEQRLPYRSQWTAAAIEGAVAGLHGFEPWNPAFDNLRIPVPELQERSLFPASVAGESEGPPAAREARPVGEEDRAILERLRELGSDLSIPSHGRHFLLFPNQRTASQAAEKLTQAGFQTNVVRTDQAEPVVLVAEHQLLLSEESIARTTSELEATASRFQGEYDGWEAGVGE